MAKALHYTRAAVAVATGLIGALIILYAWRLPPFQGSVETTENAYVRGQVTIVSPQLAGYVVEIPVQDFQTVRQGDLLARIDDRIYEQKLKQAEATLEVERANLAKADQSQRSAEARVASAEAQLSGARSTLENAETTQQRAEALLARGVATQSAEDQARTALVQAQTGVRQAEAALRVAQQDLQSVIVGRQSLHAAIRNAEAAVRLAEIDLQNTRVTAPQDGRLGEIGVRLGQYVAAGTQLTALVPPRKWVIANFKERQLYGMSVGQPVSFTVDALRNARLKGRIESFAPAAGSEFSVLRPDNATGNFTKVAQRIPVRIAIEADPSVVADLAPGMSVVVTTDNAVE